MSWWAAIICALIGAAPASFMCWLTWRDVRGVKTSQQMIVELVTLLSKKRSKKKG